MQAGGQYGVPDVPQYVVGRVPPPHGHMFSLSHEMSLSPSSGHSHPHSHSSHSQHQHHQQNHPHHQQQQQQQLHVQHPQHQQHLTQSQQTQQQHGYSQQPQKQQPPQPQSQPVQPQPQPQQQQQQQQQHVQPSQQQQMVQQLGLGSDSPPEAPSPIASRPPSNNNYSKALVIVRDDSLDVEDHEALGEEGERGTSGNRWPRQETLALLKIRSDMDATFRDSSLKGPLWEEVSRKLAEMGYHRSAKKCKEKFENVHKYYKRTKDGKAGRQDGKSYRFFTQLEALYGKAGGGGSVSNKNATSLLTGGSNGSGAGGGGGFGSGTSTIQKSRGSLILSAVAGRTSGAGERTGSAHRQESDISSGLNFSSDSSDDDFEDPGESENPESRKRKRKSSKRYLLFFENVMKKVLDKQEQMQQKFLEALERRDHDRMIREEAWKRQEMARLNREQDLRSQERALSASRDAALVAFLQKVTGQTLQLPQIALQAQPASVLAPDIQDDFQHEREFYDPNSKRWPKPEVLALIKMRTGLDQKFHEPGSKALLWEEISAGMSCLGYSRTAKRCKEKWENINKYFKKAKESNKKRPENAKTCPYFHHLDALYKEGVLGGGQHKLLLDKAEDQSEDLLEQPNGSNTREDSGQAQEGDSEILAIMPAGDQNDPAGTTTSNDVAVHFFISPDQNGVKKVRTKESLIDSSSATPTALPLNLDRINSVKSFSASTKSMNPDQQAQEKDMQFGM